MINKNKLKLVSLILIVFVVMIAIFLKINNITIKDISKNTYNYISNNDSKDVKLKDETIKLFEYKDTSKIESKTIVKGITNDEFEILKSIISKYNSYLPFLDFTTLPNYTIENNSKSNENIDIRLYDSTILLSQISKNIEVYIKEDIKTIYNLLGKTFEVKEATIIDLQNCPKPPDLYINNKYETTMFGYRWYNSLFSGVCGNTTHEEILKGKDIVYNSINLKLSTNKEVTNNTSLPESVKITYRIYKYNEITPMYSNDILKEKDAIRTANGDYYLELPGNIKGDYVYVVSLKINGTDEIGVNYYFRYKNN